MKTECGWNCATSNDLYPCKICKIDVNIGCNHRTWLMPMLDENRMDWFGFAFAWNG